MKKKLLALAIGAVAALPVAAFANGPTLYGQIDLSVENVNDNLASDGELQLTTSGNTYVLRDNSSRLGVRGEADTSVDGLKGIYQAEFGLEADDGGSLSGTSLDQRNIFVGLKSDDLGTVKMGNFDTPFKTAQGKVDQFNDGTLDIERGVANETRAANIVQYSSPVIADLVTVNAAVTTEEGGVATNDTESANSVSVVYDKDGLYLALASDNNVLNDSGGAELAGGVQTDAMRVVVGYTADALEIGFLYQNGEQGDLEDTAMMVSGGLKVGSWKFKAQYGMVEGDDGVAGTQDEELTSLAVGADYALGKSTTAYALMGTEESDLADNSRDVIGIGLRQKF